MNKAKLILMASALLITSSSANVGANTELEPPQGAVSVFFGGAIPIGSTRRISEKGAFSGGGSFAIYVSPVTSIGVLVSFSGLSKDSISDSCANKSWCREGIVLFHEYSLNLKRFLPVNSQTLPYLTGSVGWRWYQNLSDSFIDQRKDIKKWGLGYSFGAGIQIFPIRNKNDYKIAVFSEFTMSKFFTPDEFNFIAPFRIGIVYTFQ